MNYQDVALALLKDLRVEPTRQYVEEIILILETIEEKVNIAWEQYLTNDTNEILMLDNIKCNHCHDPIQIVRTIPSTVYVGQD